MLFTVSIARAQRRIEADKIASDNFFKISFIEKYQKIVKDKDVVSLKLKIREYDNNIIKAMSVKDDITIHHIKNGRLDEDEESQTLNINHEGSGMSHTDEGFDKEWLNNKSAFCYIKFLINEPSDLCFLREGEIYRFELNIIAKNIFGVEVKCQLLPWFKIVENKNGKVKMEVKHNFGDYDSVKYVG